MGSLINAPVALNMAAFTEKQGIFGKLQHKVAEALASAHSIERITAVTDHEVVRLTVHAIEQ